MTTLEATVEIVKSALQGPTTSTASSAHILMDDQKCIKLVNSIEAIYKKLLSLESGDHS
jgi:hypothetical protein